ncbi:MAG: hypothetical protein JWO13_1290 [Acidobacteriales bacterium]|nr:hypothetical protein [Terriglobales bacterium]
MLVFFCIIFIPDVSNVDQPNPGTLLLIVERKCLTGPRILKLRNPRHLTLVARLGDKVVPARSAVPHTRIERHGYIADILVSKNGDGDLFHYIIQRSGSAEVLHWGQELSFQRAMECVEEHLNDLKQKFA